MKLNVLGLLFLVATITQAQSFTVNGTITDNSGEVLIGANIYITALDQGATTNSYGYYSIELAAEDSITMLFSYLGYQTLIKKVKLSSDLLLDVELIPIVSELDEVVVMANENRANLKSSQMSVLEVPIKQIKEIPAILGEVDIIKVVQLLPGVQAGNEGTTGFHVRGGNTDQNLVQLDEAVVYNPSHLFGFFSTFNSRAINNVSLVKGGFPAQFGGRLSSILDITMKEGNNKEMKVEGGLGLISNQLTVEGPIKKDQSSFIVSGRRTHFDYLIKPFLPKGLRTNYVFYDVNAKANWKLGPKDRIYVSAFKGQDDFSYLEDNIEYNIAFGNSIATVRWNHLFGSKLFLNTSLIYNDYHQNVTAVQDNAFTSIATGIKDWSSKLDFQYFPNNNHSIRFGAHYTNHTFRSFGTSNAKSDTEPTPGLNSNAAPARYFDELALYLNDDIQLGEKLSLNLGVRAPAFLSRTVNYYRIEPRSSLRILTSASSSIKASYTIMNQFAHLVPSSTASVPTEVWIPSSQSTLPQVSQQFALGFFKNFAKDKLEASVEFYYKDMDNQVLFREGNQLIESLNIDSALVYGQGRSYGAEFYLRKKTGLLTGWLSYTLSWTQQQFPDLNFGETFPFRFDRRHNLSVVGTYKLTDRWSISGVFVYTSGSTYTLPVGRFNAFHGGTLFEGNYFIYRDRNNARLNAYHRLDLSASYQHEGRFFKKAYQGEWRFGIYNLYNRLNPYFVYFDVDPLTNQPKARQVSLLPIIPSISYNFSF